MSEHTATIVNITDQRYLASRTYGAFVIPGAAPGERYSLTTVQTRNGVIDMGDKHHFDFPILAREIAADIAQQINSNAGENSFLGVFVAAGDEPTEEELQDARNRLLSFYNGVVKAADQEWERTHNHYMLPDVARRGARFMGVEREWTYDPTELKPCPVCGERLRPNVAVCKACGAILDPVKAAQYGLSEKTKSEEGLKPSVLSED